MSQALLHPGAPAIPGLIEWLVGDECRALDDKEMIEGLGVRLRAAGSAARPPDVTPAHVAPADHRPDARLGAQRAG